VTTQQTFDGSLDGIPAGARNDYYQGPWGAGGLTFYMKTYRDPTTFDEQIQMFFQRHSGRECDSGRLDVDHNHTHACEIATLICVDRRICYRQDRNYDRCSTSTRAVRQPIRGLRRDL